MPVVVAVNPLAVMEEVQISPLWRNHCEHMARDGLSYAQSIAPVETGTYRDALFADVSASTVSDGVPGAPSAKIGNTCDHWVEVEFQQPMRYLVLLHTLDYLAQGD